MLSSYVESYKVPVERMVRSTIPSGAGKKDNERKSIRKRKKNPPRDVSQYGERIDAEASTESDSPYEVVLLRRRRLQHPTGARDAYGTKHQIHLRLPHMTFSCGIRSVEFTSEAGKARSASQNLQRRRITIRYVHVPH